MTIHNQLSVRPLDEIDIPILSEYWYDKRILLHQVTATKTRVTYKDCHQQLLAWWENLQVRCWGVWRDKELLGGAFVQFEPIKLGAVLLAWVIDLHTPYQSGCAKALLGAIKPQTSTLWIPESPMLLVEKAFWLSVGAQKAKRAENKGLSVSL